MLKHIDTTHNRMQPFQAGEAHTFFEERSPKFHRIKGEVQVGSEVLTAVRTKMAVFCVVAPCSLVEVYPRFRGPCCASIIRVNFYQTG
jgi:hypothetical protein